MPDLALALEHLQELVLWVDQYAAAREDVVEATSAAATGVVAGLLVQGAVYDDASVAAAAVEVVDVVATGQRAVAEAAATLQERTLDVLLSAPLPGAPSRGPRAPLRRLGALPAALRGVDPREVWQRPAQQYRYARSVGLDDAQATARAMDRADALARDDVGLAERVSTQRSLQAAGDRVRGYRRVVRPERSESGTCGLCLAASDRVYKVGTLLPVHGGCKCVVMAWLRGQQDPGRALNDDELERLYGVAGSTGAADLARTRWRADEHGELGPVLVPEGAPDAATRPSAQAL